MKLVISISIAELKEMAESMYGGLVKADVDLAKGIVHAECVARRVGRGCKNKDPEADFGDCA